MIKDRLVVFGKLMLLALYLIYYVAATSFYHAHYFEGRAVVHSHLCCIWEAGADRGAPHEHSPAQLRAIALLMDIIVLGLSLFCVFFAAGFLGRVCLFYRAGAGVAGDFYRSARAPPLCNF